MKISEIIFGPVPSRRLGRSLGINNIPAKHCTYSCVYCQLGRTTNMQIDRENFYEPKSIYEAVKEKIRLAELHDEKIDFITFVPDGEPTLDINLGETISLLKKLNIPIAVITNSSLVWRDDVQSDLRKADLVSFKVDAVSEPNWRKIDRAHGKLNHDEILKSLLEFSQTFSGSLITETMLINNIDYSEELSAIADYLAQLKLTKAYIAIPTRPPAEQWVEPVSEEILHLAWQTFVEKLGSDRVQYLIGYEGNAFAHTGNVKEDILSITAVHPMRRDAIEKFLKETNTSLELIDRLVKNGDIVELNYKDHLYYIRKIKRIKRN